MSFIDINRTKDVLGKLADRRRRANRTTAAGVIIPGKN